MIHQLEITTRCNYDCYYCAGRLMKQQDMSWERFTSIINSIPPGHHTVVLQGEGEPTLHPRLFDMAAYVASKSFPVTTTINGSRVDCERISALFPTIDISIDTLSEEDAARIGRHNLKKVLENVVSLSKVMDPSRITIRTVNYGQDIQPLIEWTKQHRFQHRVQKLNQKSDYGKRYVVNFPKLNKPVSTCHFLRHQAVRFYPVEGPTLPCIFLKDFSGIESIDHLAARLKNNDPPFGCTGCSFLQ